ncbi:hydrogen gas-evolving membrane-bound hydrogenase subunit E [Propioniciclava tarda]|uniref:DUF4040 domain-containing protein n=1 Tax=Propioniciclava tarda TaxID=433330 RepID=A0A4Q9KL93_PROTD|nr:hydrogen gas-evolving membrane-bound hydrogenase subunit E [Propioniciclava tarda]TBT94429.1 DUF4040 domain-containing protein [Propioniciclava tarda]SMO70641.1 multisubunit sodium/proton antiporter, MrpA subunit /multisubunit sodium/proton antiporter, MrpB subunit [Propioniciclava tarda]
MSTSILPLLLAAALALVVVAWLGGRFAGRAIGWAIATGLGSLFAATVALWATKTAETPDASQSWLPTLGLALRLRLDGLSLLFALVVLGIGALVMAYCVNYLPPGRHGPFYALLTFFAFAMLGLVLADDLILLWVFWEFTTVTSFLLIQQVGPKGRRPAIRTFVVTGAGGLSLLAAVTLTATATGTTRLTDALASPLWTQRPATTALIGTLVALAAFTKSAQFPFHAWLPDAMVASTPVSAYLHAAAMVKAGIYLLLRFSTAFAGTPTWTILLVTVGLLTAVYGATLALRRHDLKELLAYSTVSQLGFLVATIGVGTGYALVGAVVHVVAHALFKSALFMSVGLIDHSAGTRDLRRLSGLRRSMPATAVLLSVAAASMAGLPPLFGFVSKEAMFKGFAAAPWASGLVGAAIVAAVAGASLTFAYSARMLLPLFGPPMDAPPHEAPAAMIAPVAVAAGGGVVFGVADPLLTTFITDAARAIAPTASEADLSLWHGLTPALGMTLAVYVVGALLVIGRRRVESVQGAFPTPRRAVDVLEALISSSVRAGRRLGDLTRSDALFRHLLPPLVAFSIIGLAGATASGWRLPADSTTRPLDWAMLALIAIGVVLTLRARSRVALVTIVGVAGFAMAVLFVSLGATDVALTQLLVEILTVVVMVLLLVRLPTSFHVVRRRRLRVALSAGVLAGVAMLGVALVVVGADFLSDAGRTYLARTKELTGASNVVNSILVDFRAFDTFGELVVLGMAGVATAVALQSRGLLPLRPSPLVVPDDSPAADPVANGLVLRVIERLVGPLLVVLSLWFFVRGHYYPGGGFIAALVASAGLCLIFLAAPDDRVARLRGSAMRLIGAGIALATVVGLVGLAVGSFLRPIGTKVADFSISTALLFDVGVYLAVIGLVLAALRLLGTDSDARPPRRRPTGITVKGGE